MTGAFDTPTWSIYRSNGGARQNANARHAHSKAPMRKMLSHSMKTQPSAAMIASASNQRCGQLKTFQSPKPKPENRNAATMLCKVAREGHFPERLQRSKERAPGHETPDQHEHANPPQAHRETTELERQSRERGKFAVV